MNIFFVYSSGDCESGRSVWNIAPDTVIRFTIYPKEKPKLSDLHIDESKFEKKQDIGDALIYVDRDGGFSMDVQQGAVMSYSYGPSAGDEYLRCPGYDGISFSSSIPTELRKRLLARLNQYVECSLARDFEKQYELYLPEFSAKMFPAKTKREFADWARRSGAFNEMWLEFKPQSIDETDDKTYGKLYEVFGLARTLREGMVVKSYRKTQLVMKGKELYFVDLFQLVPL